MKILIIYCEEKFLSRLEKKLVIPFTKVSSTFPFSELSVFTSKRNWVLLQEETDPNTLFLASQANKILYFGKVLEEDKILLSRFPSKILLIQGKRDIFLLERAIEKGYSFLD